jgi:Fur family ferric uptake transcriptional regulator
MISYFNFQSQLTQLDCKNEKKYLKCNCVAIIIFVNFTIIYILDLTNNMASIDKTLHDHGLRKTVFRVELINLFISSKSSLSVDEIKKKAGSTNDKVTIYRALDSFEKCGLIHKVPDKENLTRFALCHSDCSVKGHIHNHAHFICTNCDDTFCLDETEIPSIKLPKGYHVDNSKLTLEGECARCHQL